MDEDFWRGKNLEYIAKELAQSDLLKNVIYDCGECDMISQDICSALLADDSTRSNKARNLICHIQESCRVGTAQVEGVVEIFYRNGFKSVAEHIHPKMTALYNTRDSNCEFNGDLRTLPNLHPSASLPVLPSIPRSHTDSSISYPQGLCEMGRDPIEIRVIPSRFIYGASYEDGIYRNASNPRGYVFMVNISEFANDVYKARKGSHVDARNLRTLFTQMGYVVDEHSNLKYMELKKALTKFSEDERLWRVDSCVVAIMSHGEKNSIITSDNRKLDWSDIRDYFSNVNCKQLIGKPKIFIFQCCRGTSPDIGVETWSPMVNVSNDRSESDYITTDGVAMGKTMSITSQPTLSDMYFIFATIEGYVAYLNSERGSWLVEAICLEFMEHSHNTDLDALMKKVGARLCNFHSHEGRKQSSETRQIHFLKHFYFNPQPLEESSLPDLDALSRALPQSTHSSTLSLIPATPPHMRRHIIWENNSRCSTPEFGFDLQNSSSATFKLRSRHGSAASATSRDFSPPRGHNDRRSSLNLPTNFYSDRNGSNGLSFANEDVVDIPRRKANLDVPRTAGYAWDVQNVAGSIMDVQNVAGSIMDVQDVAEMTGTAEDFQRWRLRNTRNRDGAEVDISTSLKRQLSIPSETEAMNKLYSIKNYLQVNDLDELVPALDPIRDVIMKNKSRHKKKKENQSNSLDI